MEFGRAKGYANKHFRGNPWLAVVLSVLCLGTVLAGCAKDKSMDEKAKPAREVAPKVLRTYDDGWVRLELGSVGMTLDLPASVERDDSGFFLQGEQIHARFSCHALVKDNLHIDISGLSAKSASSVDHDEIVQLTGDGFINFDPENGRFSVSQVTVAGRRASLIDASRTYEGKQHFAKALVITEGRGEWTIVVDGDEKTTRDLVAKTMDRIMRNLELDPKKATLFE